MSRVHRHAAIHYLTHAVSGLTGVPGLTGPQQIQRLAEVTSLVTRALSHVQAAIHSKAETLDLELERERETANEAPPITDGEVEAFVDFLEDNFLADIIKSFPMEDEA